MDERNVNELLKKLEEYRKELANDQQASQRFLEKSGIITMEERINESFSHLCIPQEQD